LGFDTTAEITSSSSKSATSQSYWISAWRLFQISMKHNAATTQHRKINFRKKTKEQNKKINYSCAVEAETI